MAIKTTGALRTFVAAAMEELRAGNMELEKASLIVKMAGRITESLFSEAKTQQLLIECGSKPGRIGTQSIGEDAAESSVRVA